MKIVVVVVVVDFSCFLIAGVRNLSVYEPP